MPQQGPSITINANVGSSGTLSIPGVNNSPSFNSSNSSMSVPVGTGYNNKDVTTEKTRTIYSYNPNMGKYIASVFGIDLSLDGRYSYLTAGGEESSQGTTQGQAGSSSTTGDTTQKLDKKTKTVIQGVMSAENYLAQSGGGSGSSGSGTGGTSGGGSGGIAGISAGITGSIAGAKADLAELLKPVSTFTGATLGTLANMLKNPMGAPLALAEGVASVLDRVSPGFTNRIDATIKKYNLENLANLPTQIVGGVRNLLSMVDRLLAVPFAYLEDLYNGLMAIMQQISKLVDDLIASIFDFFFGPGGVLDQLFPLSLVLEVLQAAGEFVAFFGAINSMFGGFTAVTNIIGQVNGFISQATSILSNPQALIMSYLPSQATQFLSAIRNPEQFLNQIIPPEVSGLLGQIGNISGLGFSSNLGYGLEGVLSSIKGGILTKVFDQYVQQIGIISPKLGKGDAGGPGATQQDHPSVVKTSAIGGQPVAQGVPIDLEARRRVLPDKTEGSTSGQGSTNSSSSNNSGLRIEKDSGGSGISWIVDSSGQVVREANDTEVSTGVIQ